MDDRSAAAYKRRLSAINRRVSINVADDSVKTQG